VSIVVLRYREPARKRPYRMPLSVRIGGAILALLVLAAVLWVAVDLSPLRVLASSVPSWPAIVKMLQLTGRALGAPVVAVLFVAINVILFLLLRRAPKGVDVS
jgi:amino acid transporter